MNEIIPIPIDQWKPDDPDGTLYALDNDTGEIIAKLPDGQLKRYKLAPIVTVKP